jgi:ribosomal protein L40E
MDFLEDLFDFGDRNRRKKGNYTQNEDHHDEHDDGHAQYNQNPANTAYPQMPPNPVAFPVGVVCRKCSTQTVQGAKFCHACGSPIDTILNCASCGSKLPPNALFCSQCGFKNG